MRDIDKARAKCFEWQQHLNLERQQLAFQEERVRNAESGLNNALREWEALRDSLLNEVRKS